MARFWITPTAKSHVTKVTRDTRRKWGRAQSEKYRAALRAGFQRIADDHASLNSPHRDGLAEGTDFVLHLVEHHYVAFQAYRGDVIIVGVFHESMDIPSRLRELHGMSRQDIGAVEHEIDTILKN